MRKLFIAGNWKMNLDLAGAKALAAAVKEVASTNPSVTIGVGPTFVQLQTVAAELAGTDVSTCGEVNIDAEQVPVLPVRDGYDLVRIVGRFVNRELGNIPEAHRKTSQFSGQKNCEVPGLGSRV